MNDKELKICEGQTPAEPFTKEELKNSPLIDQIIKTANELAKSGYVPEISPNTEFIDKMIIEDMAKRFKEKEDV